VHVVPLTQPRYALLERRYVEWAGWRDQLDVGARTERGRCECEVWARHGEACSRA
jgi:hypothetical protein